MFKFLKSKKGFTLVELMIVVVIMAILVAVAVPIYSAVTNNARKKTCIGNQREIVSTVSNSAMLAGVKIENKSFTITTNATGDNGTFANGTGDAALDETGEFSFTSIKNSFKTVPFCPVAGDVITVTISVAADGSGCNVSTKCESVNGEARALTDHVLATNTAA